MVEQQLVPVQQILVGRSTRVRLTPARTHQQRFDLGLVLVVRAHRQRRTIFHLLVRVATGAVVQFVP